MKKYLKKSYDIWQVSSRTIGIFLSTSAFFMVIVGLFTAQALWVAWSGAFSMAYDEYYHLGIIQEYAKNWLPIIQQPPGPAELGAVTRDPSFLYHYLMSFPWRLVRVLWDSFAMQMIALRVLNITMFVTGLYFYWRVLRNAGLSKRLANGVMLFFTLIPTTILMAAQLNYDNLMFLMAGVGLYLASDILLELRKNSSLVLSKCIVLVTVLMAGSIAKYAFLPLGVAIGAFVAFKIVQSARADSTLIGDALAETKESLKRPAFIGTFAVLVLIGGLFTARIGVNVIRYHTPAPDCAQILPLEQCMAHDPYGRNVRYKQENFAKNLDTADKLGYPIRWYNKMLRESFFAVGPREIWYVSGPPLPLGELAGKVISFTLIVVLVWRGSWLWKHNDVFKLFIAASLAYVGVLYARNFSEYLSLGIPVAIHGRYLVYVLPLMGAMTVVALRDVIVGHKVARKAAVSVSAILLVMMLFGGGWLPWVIRSGDNWMWSHAVPATRALRSALWHVIPK